MTSLKSIPLKLMAYLILSGCTVSSPWELTQPVDGNASIETIKDNVTVIFTCRIPTAEGPAPTYGVRLKTSKSPSDRTAVVNISRLRDSLALILFTSEKTETHYFAFMNEDEASRVFSAISESGGIRFKSEGWLDLELGAADDDVGKFANFVRICNG